MRGKIIGVFTIVVLLVGGLAFGLMRATIGDVSNRDDSSRAVTAAVTQLELEALRIERWLSSQVATRTKLREPFDAGTPAARNKAATEAADEVNEAAKRDPVFSSTAPALVVVVDTKGVVLGRNGSALMRGEKLGERYPAMLETIASGRTGSDAWLSAAKNEQMLASYAPLRDGQGTVVGAIAIGTPFSDDRLAQVAGGTSASMLLAAVPSGDKLELVAKSASASSQLEEALRSEAARGASRQALEASGTVDLGGLPANLFGSARRLSGYGDGKRAVIMAVTPAQVVGSLSSLLWPALGVTLLGIMLTFICGYLLDNYISRPISDLEEGLLAIINGQREIRFELEHAVLGGLVFRINSLLNELLGVKEDDTDSEGRASVAPSSSAFTDALNVDERIASLTAAEVQDAKGLAAEPAETYYRRVFQEYRDAKIALGDPVDHITLGAFTRRLKESEGDLSEKHSKPYRFQIKVEDKEVVLVAVPLA
jgi:HAMP domain-containing protein